MVSYPVTVYAYFGMTLMGPKVCVLVSVLSYGTAILMALCHLISDKRAVVKLTKYKGLNLAFIYPHP